MLVDSFIPPVAKLSETRDVVELFFVLDAFKPSVVDVFEDRDVIELFFVLDTFELEIAACDEELARAAAVFTVEVAVLVSIDEALKLALALREVELVRCIDVVFVEVNCAVEVVEDGEPIRQSQTPVI